MRQLALRFLSSTHRAPPRRAPTARRRCCRCYRCGSSVRAAARPAEPDLPHQLRGAAVQGRRRGVFTAVLWGGRGGLRGSRRVHMRPQAVWSSGRAMRWSGCQHPLLCSPCPPLLPSWACAMAGTPACAARAMQLRGGRWQPALAAPPHPNTNAAPHHSSKAGPPSAPSPHCGPTGPCLPTPPLSSPLAPGLVQARAAPR
jgi:hypothetical protein